MLMSHRKEEDQMITASPSIPVLPQKEIALRPWLQEQARQAHKTEDEFIRDAADSLSAEDLKRMSKFVEDASYLRVNADDQAYIATALRNQGIVNGDLIQGFIGTLAVNAFGTQLFGRLS